MYVELNHIQKRFGNYQASDDVSFGIEKGKLIGLLGPSGSGKTTILRMIAGLEHPDSGEIQDRRESGQQYPGKQAWHRLCVPELRIVPVHDRV